MKRKARAERAVLRRNLRPFKATESYDEIHRFGDSDGGATRNVLIGKRNVYKYASDSEDFYNENEIGTYERFKRLSVLARLDVKNSNYDRIIMEKCKVREYHSIESRSGACIHKGHNSGSLISKRPELEKSLKIPYSLFLDSENRGLKCGDIRYSRRYAEEMREYIEALYMGGLMTRRQRHSATRELDFLLKYRPEIFEDMHTQNYGYKNGQIKIIDYAGY